MAKKCKARAAVPEVLSSRQTGLELRVMLTIEGSLVLVGSTVVIQHDSICTWHFSRKSAHQIWIALLAPCLLPLYPLLALILLKHSHHNTVRVLRRKLRYSVQTTIRSTTIEIEGAWSMCTSSYQGVLG
jgi:hypothetical protein